MFTRLIFGITALAMYAIPQTPQAPAPLHTVEPVIVRDGSVKLDVYSLSRSGGQVGPGGVITTTASPDNQATLNVPTGIKPTANPGRGQVITTAEKAHAMATVDGYIFDIEKLEGRKFVPYSQLQFKYVNLKWQISPKGDNP